GAQGRRPHAAPGARRGSARGQRGRPQAVPLGAGMARNAAGGRAARADRGPRTLMPARTAAVTAELAAEQGLTGEEYARVVTLLGREPTFEELGVFGVMWSEHCSYKSSRALLRQLPTHGPRVLQGPGE